MGESTLRSRGNTGAYIDTYPTIKPLLVELEIGDASLACLNVNINVD